VHRPSFAPLCAAIALVSGITETTAAQLCRPALTFKDVHFSEVRNLQRTWTAALAVEAVLDYSIGYVEPCTCRN